MHYKVTQRQEIAEQLIPMSEINDHLRLYDVQEEALLEVYRDAAISFAETYMNRALGEQTIIATLDCYRKSCYLPLGDVKEINIITALDEHQEPIHIEPTDYRFNPISNEVTFKSYCNKYSEFMISYVVGTEAQEIPKAIKLGILKLIATWFESREDVSIGVSVQEMPFSHKACFDLYRISPGV